MSEILDHAKLEGAVVQAIKDWATAYPQELVAFDRQMKQIRDAQLKKGMSEQGNMSKFGEVPATLNAILTKRFGSSWHHDVRLRGFFWQHFKVGKIRINAELPAVPGERTY